MALVYTIRGDVDEALLIRRVDQTEVRDGNGDHEYHAVAEAIEYCLVTCEGQAHQTGERDAPECFCRQNVRRDVHVRVLKVPALMPGIASLV